MPELADIRETFEIKGSGGARLHNCPLSDPHTDTGRFS